MDQLTNLSVLVGYEHCGINSCNSEIKFTYLIIA